MRFYEIRSDRPVAEKWSTLSLRISNNDKNSITPSDYPKIPNIPAENPNAADKNDLFAKRTSFLK